MQGSSALVRGLRSPSAVLPVTLGQTTPGSDSGSDCPAEPSLLEAFALKPAEKQEPTSHD